MSREEYPKEDIDDLSELEAELAALVPRAEKLNRDRLMFLAGQASVESKIGTCGAGVSPASAAGTAAPREPLRRPEAIQPRQPTRWAWPAAFASMTGIAAALLVALVIRPAPQVTERIVTVPPARQELAVAVVQDHAEPSPPAPLPSSRTREAGAGSFSLPDWLAWGFFPQPAVATKHEPSFPELRNQVLLHGFEPRKTLASEPAASGWAHDEPVTAGEMLNRWLEQEGGENGVRRVTIPTLQNPTGAKS